MQLIDDFLNGSLFAPKRLLESREFYSPQRSTLLQDENLARWARKVAIQPELVCARELAGLSDDELCSLDSDFVRMPVRRRPDFLRHTFRASAMQGAAGLALLALQGIASALGAGDFRILEVLTVALLAGATGALAIGALVSFSMANLDISHGKTGLYVGVLNEQHPWLYDCAALLRHSAANDYRERVLTTRGPLRGVDFIIMRDIVRSHDTLQRTEWARSVAAQIQAMPVALALATEEAPQAATVEPTIISEPRLVSVSMARADRTRAS